VTAQKTNNAVTNTFFIILSSLKWKILLYKELSKQKKTPTA